MGTLLPPLWHLGFLHSAGRAAYMDETMCHSAAPAATPPPLLPRHAGLALVHGVPLGFHLASSFHKAQGLVTSAQGGPLAGGGADPFVMADLEETDPQASLHCTGFACQRRVGRS